jgi:bacillithiol biosynthesis cysteine-adding enzyme BshC
MPSDCISYQDSGYFSPLIVDYLNRKQNLDGLYNRYPSPENFEAQITQKKENFSDAKRKVLVDALNDQYKDFEIPDLTKQHIATLSSGNTFTITTGHQLNLFTGPLYFLYKIISVINLTKELKLKYPQNDFVPVYWMATEDHDFDEINYFSFKGKKFRWNRESSGAVGHLSTEGLEKMLSLFSMDLGPSENAETLRSMFRDAYLKHSNLAAATRWLANRLFGEQGLVIVDGDHAGLKKEFSPFVREELLHQTAFANVTKTIEKLKDYDIQVNPREINLFYLDQKLRERIVLESETYHINNTTLRFSREEILAELEQHPEKFSPNVIMRPLYQEVILPNLCYIGGGGEIAYWLELKAYFDSAGIPFPILLLRNSALLVTEKQAKKAQALHLDWTDLFLKREKLVNKKIREISEFPIDFEPQREFLKKQFADLHQLASQTDKSFSGAVKAQETRQLNGLGKLEKRLLKAQKKKHTDDLERITNLHEALFPHQSLQERQANFSEFYLENGNSLLTRLIAELKPLEENFKILVL